ncbi:MAG: aldo/keto reductase [Spirochaetales bacterium]|nr:aldo/keto reductase [Spirochaetales bacterium]
MNYSFFGSTGLRMSRIAFGVQTFGWSVEEKDAFRLLDIYTGSGGNYIDVADSYNDGKSEIITGNWLKERGDRDSLLIGTKVFFPTGDGPNDSGLSRKHIIDSVERSLRRLNTDYIDLYQLHCFDRMTPIEEINMTMDILIRDGKIRHYGLSNYTASSIVKTYYTSREQGFCQPSSLQLEYSLLVRSSEWELLSVCGEYGLGILAWSPLSGGWLTGKYRRDKAVPADSRAGVGDRWDDNEKQRGGDTTWKIIDVLESVSQRTRRTISQMSLAWLMKKKPAVFPLIGARTEAQLTDNLGADDFVLSSDDEKLLDEASAVSEPYPYNFIERYSRKERTDV